MVRKKTVLVIGASRGLGLALATQYCERNWHVIATSRGRSPGLDELRARFPNSLEIETLDIVALTSVRALRARLDRREIDTLFVNAGICKANELTPVQVDEQDFLDMMLSKSLSPVRLIEVFHHQVSE